MPLSGMIYPMQRFGPALMVACFALAGCIGSQDDIDVTPNASSGSDVLALAPLPAERFDGVPTRIGFEPIPLEGGAFPALAGFAFLPDSDEFLAVNVFGKVAHFRLEGERAVMLGSFQIPAIYTGGDCAASSIVLDPEFAENNLFYVGYCIDVQYNVIKRYRMSAEKFEDTLYTSANVLAAGDAKADAAQHAMGALSFAPDGAMWATMGDRRREENAQDLRTELGKIIRFIPRKQPNTNGYSLPTKGTFISPRPKSPLVHAYGFADPWKGAFDSRGRYWVADAGGSVYQEINLMAAAGQNFGWPDSDGRRCSIDDCDAIRPPLRSWDNAADHPFILDDLLARAEEDVRAAWVGIEYRPSPKDLYGGLLTGKMLYGDFYAGFVRAIAVGADGMVADDRHVGHLEFPVAWQQGRDGYLYAGTMYESAEAQAEYSNTGESEGGQGSLWRVVPLP